MYRRPNEINEQESFIGELCQHTTPRSLLLGLKMGEGVTSIRLKRME